ncbi:DoxX family protein [Hymenobacter sp. GOD-10R]|uniref:DoxX family protein n=1 Tax=Hymenobacter sp. GOD-10R TaxID=3093922 RepID=UPI002D78A4E9|nr:DoxX family protein [Hymenobacter sp. GOD-10R]WRQ30588.1 DoxX family protein [Hymenobacter sp. GOD-10R]
MKKLLLATAMSSSLTQDSIYLLFRIHVGLSIALGAGWSKLVNLSATTEWDKLLTHPNTLGAPDWFVQQVANLGFTFPSPYLWAALAVWGEFMGGLLVAAGLFTRLAAAQLAMQFLVLAFFWYEKPEFLLGMYYQQLLFWAFVLLSSLGGGRFSLDNWLGKRRPLVVAGSWKAGALTAVLSCLTLVCAQAQRLTEPNAVTRADLQPLLQPGWQGTLTYRDYQNQQLVTLPTQLNVVGSTPQELTLNYTYLEPSGKTVKGIDHLRVQGAGSQLSWDGLVMQVQSKQQLPQRTLRLVLVGEEQDDNRPATIRRTVLLAERQYSVRKEVRFQGDTTFLLRNEYQFQR